MASEILGAGCSSDCGRGCGTARCAAVGTGCGACFLGSCTAFDFLAASQTVRRSGFCLRPTKFERFFFGLDPDGTLPRFFDFTLLLYKDELLTGGKFGSIVFLIRRGLSCAPLLAPSFLSPRLTTGLDFGAVFK